LQVAQHSTSTGLLALGPYFLQFGIVRQIKLPDQWDISIAPQVRGDYFPAILEDDLEFAPFKSQESSVRRGSFFRTNVVVLPTRPDHLGIIPQILESLPEIAVLAKVSILQIFHSTQDFQLATLLTGEAIRLILAPALVALDAHSMGILLATVTTDPPAH